MLKNKKLILLVISAILFPIVFLYLQFSMQNLISFRLHDSFVQPVCGATLPIYDFKPGCVCTTEIIPAFGFPVRWTGYGVCEHKENGLAKGIDLSLGVVMELILIFLLVESAKSLRLKPRT